LDKAKAREEADESKCLVKTISIKSPFNLTCSTISNDGRFLAASDASALYVFSLNVEEEDDTVNVQPTKLHIPKGCGRPSTVLKFDATGRLICATVDGSIRVLQLTPASSEDVGVAYTVSQEHVFEEHMSVTGCHHISPIVKLDVSIDGKWLAAARFSRNKGSVHVFSLEPLGHWWALPEMEAKTTCIKFLGGGTLAVGCSNNAFHIFNLQRRSLSAWSHDMGLPISKSLPRELTSRTEPMSWILSMPSSDQKLILVRCQVDFTLHPFSFNFISFVTLFLQGAHGFFCVVDMDQPVPDKSITFPIDSLRAKRSIVHHDDAEVFPPQSKRQKHPPNVTNKNFTICLRYSNLLFQDFVNENEMVVVEEPWMSILEELPDALSRRVFGT
jgi:U3 small nucleolar RNA-associated protein 4